MKRTIELACALWIALCANAAFASEAGPEEAPVEGEIEEAPVEGEIEEALVEGEDAPDRDEMVERINAVLSGFAAEPSLSELQETALRLADADVEGARTWRLSSNLSALLPVVKVVYERDLERDESLDRYQDEPDKWGADTDDDTGWQVTAQWNLNELVFNPDEVRVYGALANRASRREAILTVLVGYYYERRRLQVAEILGPAVDAAEAIDRRIRIDELTAMIDSLTGGLLSRTLRARQ